MRSQNKYTSIVRIKSESVPSTSNSVIGVLNPFKPISYHLNFVRKITPITEFEVINRVVDVDGTKKIIRGVWLTTILSVIYFALLGV